MDIMVLYLFTAWFFYFLIGDRSVGCFYTCKVSGGIQWCVSESSAFAFLSWMITISRPLLFLHHLAIYRLQKILYSYHPTPLGEGDGYRNVYHVWSKSLWEGQPPTAALLKAQLSISIFIIPGKLWWSSGESLQDFHGKEHREFWLWFLFSNGLSQFSRDTFILYFIAFTSSNITRPRFHINSSLPFVPLACGNKWY